MFLQKYANLRTTRRDDGNEFFLPFFLILTCFPKFRILRFIAHIIIKNYQQTTLQNSIKKRLILQPSSHSHHIFAAINFETIFISNKYTKAKLISKFCSDEKFYSPNLSLPIKKAFHHPSKWAQITKSNKYQFKQGDGSFHGLVNKKKCSVEFVLCATLFHYCSSHPESKQKYFRCLTSIHVAPIKIDLPVRG